MRRQSFYVVAPRRAEWVEDDLPPPGEEEVLVVTRAGAISIGTELPHWAGTSRNVAPDAYPLMTGYESLGVVLARGEGARDIRVGARVLAFYGHRTAALLPATRTIPVPEGVSDEAALLAILSCDAGKGVRAVRPEVTDTVLITGGGAMGLLTVFMLSASGRRRVDIIEPRTERRALALRLGARRAVAPEEEGLGERYDVGLECSGYDAAFAALQRRMRPGGRICVLSDGNHEPLTLTPHFHASEPRIAASSDGQEYHRHAAWYFDVLPAYEGALRELFGAEVPAADLNVQFTDLADGASTPIKVLVRYLEPAGG